MKLSRLLSTSAIVSTLIISSAPHASAQNTGPVLDEIVVTAQKRSESLQEVPISIIAISGDDVLERGVQRLDELGGLIPNFRVQQDPIGDKINIRGVQSGNNAGLEQSVSTFVDGVYRGRGTQSRFSFLDPGRIEVLRGPQGTLFGKNTVGGAINITAAKPTEELDALLSGTFTFDGVEEYELRGHVSGPINERVRGRLAFLYHDLAEGWVENIFYDNDEPTVEEFALRGTVEVDLTPRTLLTTRLEYGDWDQFGQPFSTLTAGPLAAFGVEDANFEQANIGSNNEVLDIGSAGNFEGETFEGAWTLKHSLDHGEITLIAAYSEYEFERELDADFSFIDVVRFDDTEDFEQTSVELRYASDWGGKFEFIGGGYFNDNDLVATGDTQFNVRAGDAPEVAVDTLLFAGCQGAIAAGIDPTTNRECILDGLVTGFDGSALEYDDFGRLHILDQDNTIFAVFGQGTYDVTDRLSVTAGLRYTYEEKTATQSAIATIFGTQEQHPIFGQGIFDASGFDGLDPFLTIGEAETHSNDLSREENSVTWNVDVFYEATDNLNLYGKAGTGFKAGGFNSFALSADPAEAEFDEESTIGGEIGAKFKFLNGAAELNVAGFYTEFTDLQTALFTGSTSFIVQNASEATTRGFEIDGRWAITDTAQLYGSLAYVDFEFDSFPNAGCTVDQLLVFRAEVGGPLATLQECAAAEVNDLTGRTSENTPEFSGNIGITNDWQLTENIDLHTTLDVLYSGEQFRQADLDPFIVDDAHTFVNAVVGVSMNEGRYRLDLIGKNLTDVESFNYGNDTPLVDLARQFAPNRPRTVAVRLTVRN